MTQGIVKSSQWVLAGKAVGVVLQFFANVMLARWLGPAEFGVFGLINTVALTLSSIIGLGLGNAAYKFAAESGQHDRERVRHFLSLILWSQLWIATGFVILLWLARAWWMAKAFPTPLPAKTIVLCLLLAWLNVLAAFLTSALNGLRLFREQNLLNVLQYGVIIAVAWLLLHWGVSGAVTAYISATAAFSAIGILVLGRVDARFFLPPPLRAYLDLRQALPFSVPYLAVFLLLGPLTTAASIHLGSISNGLYQLGLFNIANTLKTALSILPITLSPVLGAAIVQAGGAHGSDDGYERLLRSTYAALSFLVVALLVGFMFWGDWLFAVYGRAYAQAFWVFLPLAVSAGIYALVIPLEYSLIAKNKVWAIPVFCAIKGLVLLGMTRWLAGSWGALGLAWASLAAELVYCVLNVEFGIFNNIIPAFVRPVYYLLNCLLLGLMALAWVLPDVWRWGLALPLGAVLAMVIIHLHPPLAEHLARITPGFARPLLVRSLRLVISPARTGH